MSKKHLAVTLSKVPHFEKPKTHLEQYMTPSEVVAEVLWDADLQGLIQDKIVADICAGTGIFGIGAALLGAKKVLFVERDPQLASVLQGILADWEIDNYQIITADAKKVSFVADIAFCNPPFGTKEKSADSRILHNILTQCTHCYSFHKTNTLNHIASVVRLCKASIVREFHFVFKLKATMKQHKKKAYPVEVSCIHSTKGL